METKGDKFKRLATARTNKVLNDLRLLVNLGSSQYNDGTPVQREYKRKIIGKLMSSVQIVEDSWSGGKIDKDSFSLDNEDDNEGGQE